MTIPLRKIRQQEKISNLALNESANAAFGVAYDLDILYLGML
jgi:hypothetical protein